MERWVSRKQQAKEIGRVDHTRGTTGKGKFRLRKLGNGIPLKEKQNESRN